MGARTSVHAIQPHAQPGTRLARLTDTCIGRNQRRTTRPTLPTRRNDVPVWPLSYEGITPPEGFEPPTSPLARVLSHQGGAEVSTPRFGGSKMPRTTSQCDRIRTYDLSHPRGVRCQAAPHTDGAHGGDETPHGHEDGPVAYTGRNGRPLCNPTYRYGTRLAECIPPRKWLKRPRIELGRLNPELRY